MRLRQYTQCIQHTFSFLLCRFTHCCRSHIIMCASFSPLLPHRHSLSLRFVFIALQHYPNNFSPWIINKIATFAGEINVNVCEGDSCEKNKLRAFYMSVGRKIYSKEKWVLLFFIRVCNTFSYFSHMTLAFVAKLTRDFEWTHHEMRCQLVSFCSIVILSLLIHIVKSLWSYWA